MELKDTEGNCLRLFAEVENKGSKPDKIPRENLTIKIPTDSQVAAIPHCRLNRCKLSPKLGNKLL